MPTIRLQSSFFAILLILAWLTTACGASNPPSPATATAQSLRAAALATHVAGNQQATRAARSGGALQSALTWPVVFSDTFNTDSGAWPGGEASDPLANITWTIAGGRYTWEAQAADSFVWWASLETASLRDIYLAATVKQPSGPQDGEAGLIFGLDSEKNDYYLFEINNRGESALYLHTQGEWLALGGWRASPAIRAGGPNRLAVIAQEDRIQMFVNNEWVREQGDTRLERGKVGLLVGLSNAGDTGVWVFDDFELRSPEDINPEAAATPLGG